MRFGHSLHWECGLKPITSRRWPPRSSHSLHWECGLKPLQQVKTLVGLESLPSLGVWIETSWMDSNALVSCVTPFIGSVD